MNIACGERHVYSCRPCEDTINTIEEAFKEEATYYLRDKLHRCGIVLAKPWLAMLMKNLEPSPVLTEYSTVRPPGPPAQRANSWTKRYK